MYRNHRQQVVGRILTSECVQCADGEWELRGTGEIHLPDGQSIEDYAGKGMSMSFIGYDRPLSGDEALIIAAEPGHFDHETFDRAEKALDRILPGRVTEYFQFSELPPPTVIVALLDKAVDFLLGAASTLITMGIAELVAEHFSKSTTQPLEEVQLRIGILGEEPVTVIDVSADSDHDALKTSIDLSLQRCLPRLAETRAANRRGKAKRRRKQTD